MSFLLQLLAHPDTREMSLDDPKTTEIRSRIIREKKFLRNLYEEWYGRLIDNLPVCDGMVLEVGSGGGFLKKQRADALVSEVFYRFGIDVVLDAMHLPFASESLSAILMVDVFHHIPKPTLFIEEACRCLRKGGRCLCIEPWNTPWGQWVYRHLHHEPFHPDGGWSIESDGPLSGANGALPWIMLERDRSRFEKQFPRLRIMEITPMMPWSYLFSGGVSMRSFMPGWSYRWIRTLERLVAGIESLNGMFAFIILERN